MQGDPYAFCLLNLALCASESKLHAITAAPWYAISLLSQKKPMASIYFSAPVFRSRISLIRP